MPFIKGGYSYREGKELGSTGETWQRGHVDHRIRNAQDYFIHREYIGLNPVQAHRIDAAEEYYFSSAHSSFDLDAIASGAKAFFPICLSRPDQSRALRLYFRVPLVK